MRFTLEQLKAMSNYEIARRWGDGDFPFDGAAGCGHCLTSHDVYGACTLAEHEEFRARAKELWGKLENSRGGLGNVILANMEEFYALRLFYDSLYPPPEVTAAEPDSQLEKGDLTWQAYGTSQQKQRS